MHKVVVYHTISTPEVRLPANTNISPERFETHLEWLAKRKSRIVTLRKTLAEPPKKNLIAITFDDGYLDNLTVALPFLEKHDLPMTLFMAAGFIGKDGYLSADDLKFLAAHPLVTIGSHTFSHQHLTRLSKEDAIFELRESKKVLEEITGKTIDLLAYPFGDCNGEIERLSEECGYAAAWSVWNGNDTPFSRWRVPLGTNDNLPRFIAKVSPFYFPVKRFLKPPIIEPKTVGKQSEIVFAE